MANILTRDHHLLGRNLKLNDNYISNDGGDEGVRITDGGNVGIGVTDPASPLEVFSTSSQLKISYDASNYADIGVASDGHLLIDTTGTDADITLDAGGDIYFDASNGDIFFRNGSWDKFLFDVSNNPTALTIRSQNNIGDFFRIGVGAEGATTLTTIDANTSVGHLTLDVDGDIILDSQTGEFIMKKAGTEFSADNSAYAGMILGYSMIRNEAGNGNTTDGAIILDQTSLTLIESVQGTKAGVTFIAPPSGNVEIEFCASMYNTSELVFFGLSTSHSSYTEVEDIHTYDNLGNYYGDETDRFTLTMKWVVEGLSGSNTFYIWYRVANGTAYIYHGESDHHAALWHMPPVITKATALPATFSITGD